jgi:hypothetical protein
MRRAELCGLRWSDIDEDGAGLTVRQTLVELSRSQLSPGTFACEVCGGEHVGRVFRFTSDPPAMIHRFIPHTCPADLILSTVVIAISGGGEDDRTPGCRGPVVEGAHVEEVLGGCGGVGRS